MSTALQPPLFPLAWVDRIPIPIANELLEEWGHRMGPLRRPMRDDVAYALARGGQAVAIATTSTLIRERVGGGLGHLTRQNTVELSRLCACRPHLCRVMLRVWRELIFPMLGFDAAISYQDSALHSGNLYRFDGWKRAGFSRSGTDKRSGRRGRAKWIWVWPPSAANAENLSQGTAEPPEVLGV